ncbi:hypothetical protein JB92DRAFT_43369 [Gautieria morchelliformis]|nr:hypothetical protein JB92DRAFT_43369 [Gautieria morchelliformis]
MDSPSSPDNLSGIMDHSRLVACRECRRSKIRCSRIFPCDACTRRGCADICPDGIKETKRSKSDGTLMQENARLVRRIRHLEGILSSLNHPAGLSSASDDTFIDQASPGQESQSSGMSPPSDISEPRISDILSSTHDWEANPAVGDDLVIIFYDRPANVYGIGPAS